MKSALCNAQFLPSWANPSIAAGTVVTLGTFKADGVELARPTNPVYYNGDIHQYSASETYLLGNTSTTAANNLQWIKLSDTLLVCDRCILYNISWQNIYKNNTSDDTVTTQTRIIGASSGTTVTIDGHAYRVRLLTGDTTSSSSGSEWDAFNSLCSGDNSKMNWKDIYTWCSETSENGNSANRLVRGFGYADHGWIVSASFQYLYYGFRPALELIE